MIIVASKHTDIVSSASWCLINDLYQAQCPKSYRIVIQILTDRNKQQLAATCISNTMFGFWKGKSCMLTCIHMCVLKYLNLLIKQLHFHQLSNLNHKSKVNIQQHCRTNIESNNIRKGSPKLLSRIRLFRTEEFLQLATCVTSEGTKCSFQSNVMKHGIKLSVIMIIASVHHHMLDPQKKKQRASKY